jgi:RNA polymerase sigma-70 factor, ECF subfamily
MRSEAHDEFLALYKPVHERFVRYCSSHAYGIIETDDLVQETLLKTMQHFSSLKDREKLLPFMISIANNVMHNILRRRKFRGVYDEKTFSKMQAITGSAETAMDIHYLYQALNQLPEKDKEAIILFEITGYNIKEIAAIQQSNENATKTRLSRARQKLKNLLEEHPQHNISFAKALHLFTFLM